MLELDIPYIPSAREKCQINRLSGFSNDFKNKLPHVNFYSQGIFSNDKPIVPLYNVYIDEQVAKLGGEYDEGVLEATLLKGITDDALKEFNAKISQIQDNLDVFWNDKSNNKLLGELTKKVEEFLEKFFPSNTSQGLVADGATQIGDLIG